MDATVDQATLLRNAALAKKMKSGNRVSAETRLNKVVAFLNNANLQFLAVEDTYPSGTKHTAIVNAFKTVIVENKLDGLVYPIVNDDHVFLVKLIEPTDENDEDEENDN